jgi:mannose-6-phosphate isomerase-like protein (cupin superfamily)
MGVDRTPKSLGANYLDLKILALKTERTTMPQPGDVISLTDHEHLTVSVLTPDLLEVEAVWDPSGGDQQPLAHRHPNQDEHFVVHEGELAARIDGIERVLRAGDAVDVPRGTTHAMWNAGDGPARATWQVRPALRTAEMWATLDGLRRAAGRMPTPEEGAQFLQEYAPEFELVF